MAYTLHERIFRTICLFQALIAFPTMFWLGIWAWGEVVIYGYEDIYHFMFVSRPYPALLPFLPI